MNIDTYLAKMVTTFQKVLQDNLSGIYLHGSLAMGCFNPDKSDLDLLIVVNNRLSKDEQKAMTEHVLLLHDERPSGGGIELSVVLETYIRSFVYPTPFEYHYSDYHRERYQSDPDYLCGGFEDPDLAAHCTVIYHRGITLYGSPIRDLFQPVERKYYVHSILNDIGDASKEIVDQPVYYCLNLCRVLLYLQEGTVSSKLEGGEWGLRTLPSKFHSMINKCLEAYIGRGKEKKLEFDNKQLVEFAEYMQNKIHQFY
ncbi:aminoglycoside adenylyltransferase domain-containing protein [Paenibacillus lupini]|uniref:aminoglycoside adenylyltransferase domain-containing protein n=1 Tax=Paenibacillus lupini TaxID=1450204 RepID=UPI001422D02B|nr:aminoglycoside adenylyltransferase domain-containing protein [Paenibacillus lupini]NIK23504.1 streptomycin 3'-adenylyltransferase [Paenibacillus lupini]